MSVLALLFGFQGRVGRARFWLAALLWVLAVPASFLFAGGVIETLKLRVTYELFGGLMAGVLIPALVSFVAVGSKRLHDRDKSGWWLLLFFFAPYFAGPLLVPLLPIPEDPSNLELFGWLSVTVFPFFVWGLVELGFLPGTPGPNRFGDAPRKAGTALQPG